MFLMKMREKKYYVREGMHKRFHMEENGKISELNKVFQEHFPAKIYLIF